MWMLLSLLACSRCEPKIEAQPHTPVLCPPLYDEDRIPAFSIEVTDEVWASIVWDYQNWQSNLDNDRDTKIYYPLERFVYDGEVITDAQIRLKGNPCCSWEGDKMQFVIAFNQVDPDGRFQGLRKLTLDAPPYDASVLRERVALSYFEDAGLPAACANHATLHVNGAYYGLYTNIEYVDREFLERQFPGEESFGNLYKWHYNRRRFVRRNNSEGFDDVRPYRDVETLEDFEAIADMDQAMYYWAAEAVINQSDGYWAGSINYYIYNHPEKGWQYFPWDLDNAITFWGARKTPWQRRDAHRIAPVMDWVLADEAYTERFREAIDRALSHHDPDLLIERLDRWASEIRPLVEAEPHRAFSMVEHDEAVEDIRRRLQIRDTYLCGQVHKGP